MNRGLQDMTHKLALVFFVQSLLAITLPLLAAEGA
jgi:hypothetical protein